MELQQSLTLLEREAEDLGRRCAERERDARAPASAARAELETAGRALAEEEARLAQFEAEERATAKRPVLTVPRSLLASLCLGAFTWGAAAASLDLPHASMALFGGVWLAFLVGALRGK